jgi:uncharacterized membrane protein (Fun14 family)
MTVRYITVTAVANFFKPATRAFGDIAVVGSADAAATGPKKTAIPITNPDSVSDPNDPTNANGRNKLPVDDPKWFQGDLGASIRKVFAQSPGPSLVWAVQMDAADANPVAAALGVVGKLSVQIVLLANKPLIAANKAQLQALADHVATVSSTGADGMERIGVLMLAKNAAPPAAADDVTTSAARLVYVGHKSDEDAAAAVAGTIAGYEPHISLLLKPVSLAMADTFTDSEIDAFNADTARINWLTRPALIPGNGLYMGEGYIKGNAKVPYVDITRTIDDVSFRLKAQLIQSIGVLRINRPGLRTLASQMASVLEPLKQREVIDQYDVFMPLLVLLDKDPATLMPLETQEIKNARDARTVEAIITVTYAGAIHRLNITLKFQ